MSAAASRKQPQELLTATVLLATIHVRQQQMQQQQLQQAAVAGLAALWLWEGRWLQQPYLTQVSVCCLLALSILVNLFAAAQVE